MSLTNGTELTMPVVPAGMAGYGNGSSNDGWGDNGAWWIILFLIFAFCGWGNNGWNNGGNGSGTAAQGYDTRADIQRGFDTQAIETKLDGLTNGLCQQGYQNQQGFHGVDNAICQLGYQVQQGANEINTTALQGFNGMNTAMLQGFNATNTSLMQGQNALATQLADCCCQNLRGQDAINYNMATQACAIQNTMNTNTRDIIDNQNSNSRAILDYLCNDKISTLQTENQALRLAASQQAQNNYLVQSLRPAPVPAYTVPPPYQFPAHGPTM